MLKGFVTKEEKATIKNKENIIFFSKTVAKCLFNSLKKRCERWENGGMGEREDTKKKMKYRVTIMTVATNKLKWVGATTGFTLIKMNHSIYLPQSL